MQNVLSNTLSLRRREMRGGDVDYYYELFPAVGSLPPEREAELVSQAKTGNLAAEDALVRQYAGVGISMALRYRWTKSYQGVDLDALVSASLLGVVEGIRHFDPTRGARLITCVWYWVRALLGRERAKHRFIRNGPTTYASDFLLNDSGGQEAYAKDQAPSVVETLSLKEEREAINRLMDRVLNEHEIEVINRRYASCEETMVSIGKGLGVTRQRVSQIHQVALAKLQRAVGVTV